jgi:hypothetical protein
MKIFHIDTNVKKINVTAKEQAFENSTLRMFSQFERVQMNTMMKDESMNSKTMLVVHRADSVSDRERERSRKRRERKRERERRDREQAVSKET